MSKKLSFKSMMSLFHTENENIIRMLWNNYPGDFISQDRFRHGILTPSDKAYIDFYRVKGRPDLLKGNWPIHTEASDDHP